MHTLWFVTDLIESFSYLTFSPRIFIFFPSLLWLILPPLNFLIKCTWQRCYSQILRRKVNNLNLFTSQGRISYSPYCLLYSFYDVSSENSVLDQLMIPWFPDWYFSLFSSLVCLILYRYCKEKFCLGHSGGWRFILECVPLLVYP